MCAINRDPRVEENNTPHSIRMIALHIFSSGNVKLTCWEHIYVEKGGMSTGAKQLIMTDFCISKLSKSISEETNDILVTLNSVALNENYFFCSLI